MTFNVESFLNATATEEANSTKLEPVPEGEYLAIITKVNARQWQAKDDPSKSGVTLDVTWEIDDGELKARLGREKITVRQGVMLDISELTGALDTSKGKNVGLGRLREAVGLNEPGRPFAFVMLQGKVGRVVVSHRADPKDPEKIYDEVRSVGKV